MNALKKKLFVDLQDSMQFITTRGMVSNGLAVNVKDFGNTLFFTNIRNEKWSISIPDCTVISAKVNTFVDSHTITVQLCPQSTVIDQLKNIAQIVFETKNLPCTERYDSFDTFWQDCGKPTDTMTVEATCFSRRGHKKEYINIYDRDYQELTGYVSPTKNDKVTLSLRFSLSESENGHYGFRPLFDAGILIQKFGEPLLIKRPWDMNNVSESLEVNMHDSFIVKSPALTVVGMDGNCAMLDCTNKPEFVQAMNQLHQKASRYAWDHTIHLCSDKVVLINDVIIASMFCKKKEGGILEWYAYQITVSNKRKR